MQRILTLLMRELPCNTSIETGHKLSVRRNALPSIAGLFRVSILERCAFPSKELLDIPQTGSPASRWKSVDDQLPISLCIQACIENSHYAAIIAGAQQAAQALLEAQYSLGEHIGPEPVFSGGLHLSHACFVDRIIGRVKGQFIDNHQRKGFSGDINAFPEAL